MNDAERAAARATLARIRPLPIRADAPMCGGLLAEGPDETERRAHAARTAGDRARDQYDTRIDRGWDPGDPTTRPGAR